jgi:hypothetical protein
MSAPSQRHHLLKCPEMEYHAGRSLLVNRKIVKIKWNSRAVNKKLTGGM